MKSNAGRFVHKRNSALISILDLGRPDDQEEAQRELTKRGCFGFAHQQPEHGNGQVAQEEGNMNNQQHRSDEQIKRVKECLKKLSDDKLRSIFIRGGDRQLSGLARLELSARSNTPSVYEVVALTGDKVVERYLKRAISDEYVDSLLGGCDEVRVRKVEIK